MSSALSFSHSAPIVCSASPPPSQNRSTTSTTVKPVSSPNAHANRSLMRTLTRSRTTSPSSKITKEPPPEQLRLLQLVAPVPAPPRLRLILAGKPVSGKGTHAPLIARRYGCVHISLGAIIRAEIRRRTTLGAAVRRLVAAGELLPDEMVVSMLKTRLAREDVRRAGYLLDGFPRTVGQADAMEKEDIAVDCVLVLDRPDRDVVEFAAGRGEDPSTGIVYHDKFNPPPDDPALRARLVRREDDSEPVVKRRLHMFHDSFGGIFDRWSDRTIRVDSSTSRSFVDVFADISHTLDEHSLPAEEEQIVSLPLVDRVSVLTAREELGVTSFANAHLQTLPRFPPGALLRAMKQCHSGDLKEQFLPLYIGDCLAGRVARNVAVELLSTRDPEDPVFDVSLDSCSLDGWSTNAGSVRLNPRLLEPDVTSDERTKRVSGVVRALRNRGLIQGWRGEMHPVVYAPGHPPWMNIERAALPYFGIAALAVHVNGYVETREGLKVWVARRSGTKPTYPNRLDQMVAGGVTSGQSLIQTVAKECKEEANIDLNDAGVLMSSSSISYEYAVRKGLSRKSLFVYDLKLPFWFSPSAKDGEVQQFTLMPIEEAVESVCTRLEEWKPNAAMVMIDFAIRHGIVTPDREPDFLEIQRLMTSR